jgi:hypothetical protein
VSTRDVQAIIEASGYLRHGTTMLGGSFTTCTCPKTPCGGVADDAEHDDCPEHRKNPAQIWHWAAECPQALADARTAVRRDLAVFPIPAGGRVPKPGWQRRATLDAAALPELLANGGNIGIGCRASNVVALDLDVPHGGGPTHNGLETLQAQLDAQGLQWPDTYTVTTPHQGLHLYFRVPADCTIGSISGGRTALGPGIDVRGPGRRSGGYLVGPGSTVGGLAYAILKDVPVAPLPGWIADVLA